MAFSYADLVFFVTFACHPKKKKDKLCNQCLNFGDYSSRDCHIHRISFLFLHSQLLLTQMFPETTAPTEPGSRTHDELLAQGWAGVSFLWTQVTSAVPDTEAKATKAPNSRN